MKTEKDTLSYQLEQVSQAFSNLWNEIKKSFSCKKNYVSVTAVIDNKKINKALLIFSSALVVTILGLGLLIAEIENPTRECIVDGVKTEIFIYDFADDNETIITHKGETFNRSDCHLKDKK